MKVSIASTIAALMWLAACDSGSDGGAKPEPAAKPSTSACSGAACAGSSAAPPAMNGAPATTGGMAMTGSMTPATSPPMQMPAQPAMTGDEKPAGSDEMTAGQAGSGSPSAADDDGWERIVTADWELKPNEERYFCARVTLKEDLYFTAVKAINPLGTHHTALTVAASATAADGLTECNSSQLAPQGIYGSGVGTDPVIYPDGVGLHLRAGQQLLLNLHVFNVSDKPLKGTSGTAIRRAKPEEIKQVAESVLAGPPRFSVPVGRSTVTGTCTMTQDTTLFAVQPHMHQTGVHMKGVAHSSIMGDVVLHDGDYDFEQQLVYPITDVPMKKGDVVDVDCTYDNQTSAPITTGESSTQEMCFLVLHRYPAADKPSVSCFR